MEKEKFYGFLDSSGVTAENTNSLQSIIEKYPYFNSARVLFLRDIKKANPENFNEALSKNSGLLPNRRHLFIVLNPLKKEVQVNALNSNESDQSFVLLEESQIPNNNIVDITDTTKANDIPISGYDLLEINDQEGSSTNGNDLIDQFLKSNPRIKPPQQPQTEQEDISLKYTEHPDDLVTEPMAKIYLSQGLADKAISIYEKLSLKYPEKSSYFAGQIQEIKQQLNK